MEKSVKEPEMGAFVKDTIVYISLARLPVSWGTIRVGLQMNYNSYLEETTRATVASMMA